MHSAVLPVHELSLPVEGGKKGGQEGGEKGRAGGRERGKREGEREGGREGGRERGREGWREGGRKGEGGKWEGRKRRKNIDNEERYAFKILKYPSCGKFRRGITVFQSPGMSVLDWTCDFFITTCQLTSEEIISL